MFYVYISDIYICRDSDLAVGFSVPFQVRGSQNPGFWKCGPHVASCCLMLRQDNLKLAQGGLMLAQVGIKLVSCWLKLAHVGLMLAQVGSSWPPVGSSWPHVGLKLG